jgi:alanyl-tRNA synthetase
VRVIRMGAFSVELCGGTHVANSADLKVVKITSERGIAAGVRRIEAVAAKAAHVYCEKQLQDLDAQLTQSLHRFEALKDQTRVLAKTLEQEPLFAEIDLQRPQPHLEQAEDASLIPAFAKAKLDFDKQEHNLQGAIKQQERTLKQLNDKQAAAAGSALVDAAVEVAGVPLLVHKLENTEAKALRGLVDELKQKLGSGVIVLGMADGNKVNLIVGVTADLTARCKAGDLVRQMAQTVGGKGGGRPDMAQAGGQAPEKLDEALAQAEPWLVACLADS